jgi:branched-chain amino acid aminotransferase
MKVQISKSTTINSVDFSSLSFGEIFTDHMFECDFENGEWKEPKIIPYQPIKMDPSTSVFHYGQAIFEGLKAYKDKNGQVWLFRPEENLNRLNKSAIRLSIPEFPKSFFLEGLKKLLTIDKNWIKPGVGNSLYIRPFVFASQAGVQASPSNKYKFMIICSPAKSYYSGETNVKIEEKYSRAAPGGVGYAKTAGNYAAQFYPTSLAIKDGFQQIIWTDSNTNRFIEESGTMNIFVKIDNTLITTPISDTILDGVTRKSILEIAKSLGLNYEVRQLSVDELVKSSINNSLKEMFGCGTAVVINPIKSFGFRNKKYTLPIIEDPISNFLKEKIISIQYNLSEDIFNWRYKIC